MEEGKYLEVQTQLMTFAGIVLNMPLKEFLEAAERAETVGPILDPTLWMKANQRLTMIKDLARKLKAFQDEARSFKEVLTELMPDTN